MEGPDGMPDADADMDAKVEVELEHAKTVAELAKDGQSGS